MTTGYLYHELYGWADGGLSPLPPADPSVGLQPLIHIANPETKRRIHELIVVSGMIDRVRRIAPRPASDEQILRVHTPEHLARIKFESEQPKGGDAGDGISPFGKGATASQRCRRAAPSPWWRPSWPVRWTTATR